LVPYKGKATFVPGWQGLVDLVSRAGRATVWTGAVYEGDEFDWQLGDDPFVKHKPTGDSDNWNQLTYVYAIGRVNGSQYPVIEVWTIDRVLRHLKKYNKVGASHYALKDDCKHMEMYARKVALLQVLKYMPKSIEVQKAIDVSNAIDSAKSFTIDGDVVVVQDDGNFENNARSGYDDQAGSDVVMPKSKSETAKATSSDPVKDGSPTDPLTALQIDFLKNKMELSALGSADFFRKFGKKLEESLNGEFESILNWVKSPN
jgi:recombination protein RecT